MVDIDPAKLQSRGLSTQDVVTAIANAETIAPSGNVNLNGKYPIVPVNSIVTDVQALTNVPVQALGLISAADAPESDPASFALYGSHDYGEVVAGNGDEVAQAHQSESGLEIFGDKGADADEEAEGK